ncbi:MAG: hypothetical protein JO337_09370 [Acidimicrobiales bacterium]|nr:hypothetical protein [Acidimicrobiales bacterium]
MTRSKLADSNGDKHVVQDARDAVGVRMGLGRLKGRVVHVDADDLLDPTAMELAGQQAVVAAQVDARWQLAAMASK